MQHTHDIAITITRPTTLAKYRAIQTRYRELYDGKRLRIDDVEAKLCEEFFLSPLRVRAVLKMEI